MGISKIYQWCMCLVFLLPCLSNCQEKTDYPLGLVKVIFAKDTFPALKDHVKGEYKGHPNGTDFADHVTTDFLLLGQDQETAVVNLTITDSTGRQLDAYVHLIKDSLWKVSAFRALAMTGIIESIYKELKSMTDTQIDSIIFLSQEDTLGRGIFKSREEYDDKLGNCGLIIASDQDLIAHFEQHKTTFEAIKNKVLLEIDTLPLVREGTIKIGKSLESDYRSLFISSVSIGGFQFGQAVNFLIGGMVDNTVGYLYVKDKKDLPSMNPRDIIMIREIGDGWFLYKTT